MTCGIHDGTLARRLAEALLGATRTLIGERDCFADSICGGHFPDDPAEAKRQAEDEAALAEYDAEIDGYLELLAEAGVWPEIDPPIDHSDPESLPDWSLALDTIRRLVRVGDLEREALS